MTSDATRMCEVLVGLDGMAVLDVFEAKLNRVRLDAEEAVLEVRTKSLQTELVAKQVEKTLLARTKKTREGELSRGRIRMRELRRGDASIPKVAVVPIFVVWFGAGTVPAVLTSLVISIFPVVVRMCPKRNR